MPAARPGGVGWGRALVTDADGEETLRQLARRIDPAAQVRWTWRLAGGVSAQVTALELGRADGQTTKLIVRQHGTVDRTRNPHIARDEFRLLQIAQAHGLAAPKPVYVDESGALLPAPYLVIEYVEGEADFAPADLTRYLAQAAAELVRIHGIKDSPALSFLPRHGQGFGERPAVLDVSLGEARIRAALESAWPVSRLNASVLLHGDYWPGNLLWQDGRLVAVIDWEDAAVGDPLADLGNCRLEMLWAFGIAAMNEFTDQYRSMTTVDVANLPYWDLCAALRPCGKIADWGLDQTTEQRMRARHRLFVARALAACGG